MRLFAEKLVRMTMKDSSYLFFEKCFMDFACPRCSEIVKTNDDQAGQSILCPKCEGQIKVPGTALNSSSENDDQWGIFDEEEKFFEGHVNETPEAGYRTKADELEPIVDNDEEEAAKEKQEEQQAVTDALAEVKSLPTAFDHPVSSSLTIDEKMEEEEKFKTLLSDLPDDSPLKRKPWDRSNAAADTPDTLRLDGDSPGKIRAKCLVCDGVTMVKVEKAGQVIVCSDCGSDVKVPTDAESEATSTENKPQWENWVQKDSVEKQRQRKIDEQLFANASPDMSNEDTGYGLTPTDDEEYGLAPADESLLAPVSPIAFEEGIGSTADPLDGTAGFGESHSGESDPVEQTDPRTLEGKKDPSETVTSSLFEEMQSEKEAHFERLPWSKHIFGVLTDFGFIGRCLMLGLMFAVTVSIYLLAEYIGQTSNVKLLGLLLKFPAFVVAVGSLLCIFWLGQSVINTTILGQKQFDEIGGFSVFEFLSSCVFVAISFALCSIPGVTLGYSLALVVEDFDWIWLLPSLGSLTALMLVPVPLLSSLVNRTPYLIFNESVLKSFKEKSEYWIEFYPVAGIISVAVCGVWFMGATQNWPISMLMCLLLPFLFGLYFRVFGRLAGSILNDESGS